MQVIVNGQGLAIWTDNGNPAGVHDYRCIWRSDLVRKIDFAQDSLIADLGYQGKRLRVYFETPLPKGQILTLADEVTSKKFHATRVLVEHFFGVLKLRFPIFRVGYQGPSTCFVPLFRFGSSLINLLRKRNQISRVEEEQGRLLQVEDEITQIDLPYEGQLDTIETRGRVRQIQTPAIQEEQQWNDSQTNPINHPIIVDTEPTSEVANEDLSFELGMRSRLQRLRIQDNQEQNEEQTPSTLVQQRAEQLLTQCQGITQQLASFLEETRRRPRVEDISDDDMRRYRRIRRNLPQ